MFHQYITSFPGICIKKLFHKTVQDTNLEFKVDDKSHDYDYKKNI